MNARKVPQLFTFTGATEFGDPKHFPWTMGWQPTYQGEGRAYAKYLLEHQPQGKIGILSQNDDYGKDYITGLKDGLKGKMPVIAEAVYETTDPTVDSQIVSLKTSGADVFLNASTPKFAAQAIKKMVEIGWRPVHLLARPSNSVGSVLRPAGLDNATGILSSGFSKILPTPPGTMTPASRHGRLSWISISRTAIGAPVTLCSAIVSRRHSFRSSSNAATTSRARTS
jgi:branched-chain amino acid transport system substrate-binding protein